MGASSGEDVVDVQVVLVVDSVWFCFSLTVGLFTLYQYGYMRVQNLQKREFHLPMFIMFQIYAVAQCSAQACGIAGAIIFSNNGRDAMRETAVFRL